MKLKKGDVYKEKRGGYWIELTFVDSPFSFIWGLENNDPFEVLIGRTHFISQIQSGKLIKIPQIHK